MKIQFPLAFFCLLLGAFYVAARAHEPSQLIQQRSIARLPIERNEPVSIRAVKVNGRKVFRNKKFVADDDWLRGLTIDIKNRSNKVILFATIQLQFPRPPGSEGQIAVDEIFYGNYELFIRQPSAAERLQGIAPGETAEIKLASDEVEGIRILLAGNGYPASPERLDLRIGMVVFDDNTMWERGSRLRRDENSPRHWAAIEQPASSNRTSFETSTSKTSFEA
jgi:hypothetical protein